MTLPDVNSYTTYVLTVENGVAGFYKKGTDFKVYNNKAYLQVPEDAVASATALRIRFADEETTAIDNAPLTIAHEPAVIYDLHGRRVQQMEKGICIVNGKKVVK